VTIATVKDRLIHRIVAAYTMNSKPATTRTRFAVRSEKSRRAPIVQVATAAMPIASSVALHVSP